MKKGKIKFWNQAKFYGFIAEQNSDADYFFHGTSLLYENPKENDEVSFDTAQDRKKENYQEQAIKVTKI